MKKANGKSDPQVETGEKFTRKLPCKLAPRQLDEKRERVVEALTEIKRKEEELAALSAPIRGRMKELKTEVELLRRQAHEGTEDRDVQCVEEINFRDDVVRIRRIDTPGRDVVETRELTPEERQRTFPAPSPNAGKRKGKRPAANKEFQDAVDASDAKGKDVADELGD
jgi:hypothetical protein